MKKALQAKHILDSAIIEAITAIQHLGIEGGANRMNIIAAFPAMPAKVTTAKLRQATLKGIIVGCSDDVCARAGKNGCSVRYSLPETVN